MSRTIRAGIICSKCNKYFRAGEPLCEHLAAKTSRGSPHIYFPSKFQPEKNPLSDRAVLDLDVPTDEYDEMLNHHLNKHPENYPIDELDKIDYEESKRNNAGADVGFDYEKHREE